MTMNHSKARQLIQAAADGLLSEASRHALDRHLASCRQCQAYAANLGSLEARLEQGLQARWQDAQPRRFSLADAKSAASGRKESAGLKRLYHIVAIPALQFGALAALAVGLVLLIGSAAQAPHTADVGGSQTSTVTSLTEGPPGTLSATCAAVATIDVRVYRDHDSSSEVVGALPHGQTAPVVATYQNPVTNEVWLQIEYNGGLAWVANASVLLSGDCSQVSVEGPDGTIPPTYTPPATYTPIPPPGNTYAPTPAPTHAVCEMVAPSPQTLFEGPSLGGQFVGTFDTGQTGQILAWAHNGFPPVWYQIRVGNLTGWIMWPYYDPASGSPCEGLPLVPLPTPAPTATYTPAACMVAPVEYPIMDRNVYTGPATTYPVMGTLDNGQYVVATGIFSQDNYDTWIRVEYNGQEGWMDGPSLMYTGGGCWPLPPVDFVPHPATFTPSPTFPGPTPAPTYTPTPYDGTPAPPMLEFGWSVPGDVGRAETYWATFPWQGNATPTHRLSITVTGIPPGNGNDSRRVVDFRLECQGGSLTWGWASNPGTYGCGDTARSDGLLWNYNTVQFVIQAPESWTGSTITYTITASFSAYPSQ